MLSKILLLYGSKLSHSSMLILIYSQTPLRVVKNGVFKFCIVIVYYHLTFI
ncbi:hypothetical protein HMPREF1402_01423 [Helicobacter pylori GAM121Aii]|nr:hypothetical protein HMPREF1402_01423 [Helicobacter pylori GAM121Aii]